MNKKVFLTRKIPDIGIKMLIDKGYDVDMYPNDNVPSQKKLISLLSKKPYDAVICLLTDQVDFRLFDATPNTKIFASYTVGFNNIDIIEAKKRGIIITNTSGASMIPVAEHAVALMLGLTTRMIEGDIFTRKGGYKGWSPTAFIGTDLSGKTIGLVGTGAIGSEVARILFKGFGCRIIYYDLRPNDIIEKQFQAKKCDTLTDLLKEADIVTLHVPLLDTTHHLINSDNLKLMKPTAFLINTSRGPVIDEIALVEALQMGIIAGAGLDVYEFEPKLMRGLAKLKNVVLTPHIGSARQATRDKMATIAAENVIDFLEGRTPKNIVNV